MKVYKILTVKGGALVSPLMMVPYDSMKKTYPPKGWGPLTAFRSLKDADLEAKCLRRLPGLGYLEVWECEAQTVPRKTGVWYPNPRKKLMTRGFPTGTVLCRWIRPMALVGQVSRVP